jgi:hypothetical protein
LPFSDECTSQSSISPIFGSMSFAMSFAISSGIVVLNELDVVVAFVM